MWSGLKSGRQLNAHAPLYHAEGGLAEPVLARVDVGHVGGKRILDRDALPHALDRELEVVGEREDEVRGEPRHLAELDASEVHDVRGDHEDPIRDRGGGLGDAGAHVAKDALDLSLVA